MTVTIQIRYFARCRELAGTDLEYCEIASGATLADVREKIESRHPSLAPYLAITRLALNQSFVTDEMVVAEGDVVALIPPVSGGSGSRFVLSEERIPQDAAARLLPTSDGQGALATFVGIVRRESRGKEVSHLEYEAFGEMALLQLQDIEREAASRWPIFQVAVVHRIGRCDVGEVAVSIAVSASRRAAAFDACRHVIERIKEDVTIWKKEVAEDGSHWWGGAG